MSTRDEEFGFLKEDSQDILKGSLSLEPNLAFPKSSNGQHENGDVDIDDDEDDEDDDDLGPETNVDTIDDAGDYIPGNVVINREVFQQKLEQENGDDDMIKLDGVQNDIKTPEEKAGQNVFVVADADNVADSEDSEDEWNYFPNEEKDSAGAPSAPEECHPVETQENVDIHSSVDQNDCESANEEIAESHELIDTNVSGDQCSDIIKTNPFDIESKSSTSLLDQDETANMSLNFNLNPNAKEFVPESTNRSPTSIPDRMNMPDFPISGSPMKRTNLMDDIQVPNEDEFQREISRRPHELTHELSFSDSNDNETDTKVASKLFESTTEASSTKAEYGDSFYAEFQRNENSFMTDKSFSESYDIAKDPMAMSLTPGDLEIALEANKTSDSDFENCTLSKEQHVDLNAVHELRDADLIGDEVVIENIRNEWNKENCPPVVENNEAVVLENQINENLSNNEALETTEQTEDTIETEHKESSLCTETETQVEENKDEEVEKVISEHSDADEDSTTCPIETKEQLMEENIDNCQTNSEDVSPVDNAVPFKMNNEETALNNSALNESDLVCKMASINIQDTTADFEENETQVLKEYLIIEQKDVEETKHDVRELAKELDMEPLIDLPQSEPVVVEEIAIPVPEVAPLAKPSPKIKAAPPKNNTKPTTKSTPSSTKSSAKTSPTSPTKSGTTTTRTSSTVTAKKSLTNNTASKPKVLDTKPTANKASPAAGVAKTMPSSSAKSSTTRTSLTSVKSKITATATKTMEKKLTNGEVKTTASKVSSTAKVGATKLPPSGTSKTNTLVKSTNIKTSGVSAPAAKPRPTSAVSSATTFKTTTKTTTSAPTRPKTAPSGTSSITNAPKTRTVAAPRKSPMIDKQIKETANKQISSARSATTTTTKSTTTRSSTNSTTVRRMVSGTTTLKATTGTTSPTKKPITGSKGNVTKTSNTTSKTSSAVTKTSVTKAKTLQNGNCNAKKIETIETMTNEEDVPKKDVSPIISPTDNQLITTEE